MIRGLSLSAVLVFVFLSGCGEKIAIPVAEGLFSVTAYTEFDRFENTGTRQMTVANSALFVIDGDGMLSKRNHIFDILESRTGLADPTALGHDEAEDMIFVWEAGASRLSAWSSTDLEPLGYAELEDIGAVTHLAANTVGVAEFADGALTYVYLSDVENFVIHRIVWFEGGLAFPAGILCRDGGLSARSVHLPAGMATDAAGMMLVCDADTGRNWVNRFNPTPDVTDVTADPDDIDPRRGTAITFGAPTCEPPSVSDYTLGNAPGCTGTWEGGPSDEPAEFHSPVSIDVDGQGWIYVADRDNSRIQIFEGSGNFVLYFGDPEETPLPKNLVTIDQPGPGSDINYGAFVFFMDGLTGDVLKFISHDHFSHISTQPWPGD